MPRAGLTTAVVVREAALLADLSSPEDLTLAALAKRFGVALPSLYKHVRGVDDLQARVAALAAGELAEAMRRAATGVAGADAVRAVAAAYRGYASTHPGRYRLLVHARPDDPAYVCAGEDILDVLAGVFAGYGISGEPAVHAARFLRSLLHGFVSLESGDGFGIPLSVEHSFDLLVDAAHQALASWPGATAGALA